MQEAIVPQERQLQGAATCGAMAATTDKLHEVVAERQLQLWRQINSETAMISTQCESVLSGRAPRTTARVGPQQAGRPAAILAGCIQDICTLQSMQHDNLQAKIFVAASTISNLPIDQHVSAALSPLERPRGHNHGDPKVIAAVATDGAKGRKM